MAEHEIQLPMVVVGAENVPVMFVNHLIVQNDRNEFLLTLGQLTPPLVLGTPEEQADRLRALPYVPVQVIGRFSLTAQRLGEFIKVMQEQLQRFEQQRS